MKATLVIRRRIPHGDRELVEMVVWHLPKPVPPCIHSFKYRLVYVLDGCRVIGFDNERGKGDHRHLGGVEGPYRFQNVEMLMADFLKTVDEWRMEHDEA
jgi:hypothetical protein